MLRASNSYDFVRFCAASAVLFSHHFDLSGFREPKAPGFRGELGELGLAIFFCLSGFLICLSLQRSADLKRFALARVLRIYPNLLFVLVVTSALTFFWFGNDTHLGAHIRYVADNLLMFLQDATRTIPGVFEQSARRAVNEPLWSLPYELWLYVVLALLIVSTGRAWRVATVAAALVAGAAWSAGDALGDGKIGPLELTELARLGSFFLSGAMLAIVWPRIERYAIAVGFAGVAASALLNHFVAIDTIFSALALAAAVVGLGSARTMAWFAKGGDPSYGMYVFGWPVTQVTVPLVGSFWPAMAIAFAITTAIGYATWHAFEQRAMAYARRKPRREEAPAAQT